MDSNSELSREKNKKLVMLYAISTAQRVQNISLITLENIKYQIEQDQYSDQRYYKNIRGRLWAADLMPIVLPRKSSDLCHGSSQRLSERHERWSMDRWSDGGGRAWMWLSSARTTHVTPPRPRQKPPRRLPHRCYKDDRGIYQHIISFNQDLLSLDLLILFTKYKKNIRKKVVN